MKNLRLLVSVFMLMLFVQMNAQPQISEDSKETKATGETSETSTEQTGESDESDESESKETGQTDDTDDWFETDESDEWFETKESESTGDLPGETDDSAETGDSVDNSVDKRTKSVRYKVTFSETESDDTDEGDSIDTDDTNETDTADSSDPTDSTDDTDEWTNTGWTGESNESWTDTKNFDTDYRRRHKSNVSTRWFMVDLGLNNFVVEGEFEIPTAYSQWELEPIKSYEVNLHIVQQRINLIGHHVNLAYGLSLFWNRYAFENKVKLVDNSNQVELIQVQDDDPFFVESYDKNRLGTTMIAFPVLLNLETRPYRKGQSFHLNLGGYVGRLIETNLKQHSDEFGKVKITDDFNLNKWNYGLMAQLGYGALNFYVKASGNELFRVDAGGPEIYNLSFGISIIYY